MRNLITTLIVSSFIATTLIGCSSEKAEAPAEAPAAAADTKAGAEICKAACDNQRKVLLAMGADAELMAEAEKELATCPADCQKQYTAQEAKCIAETRSVEDMEKCVGVE